MCFNFLQQIKEVLTGDARAPYYCTLLCDSAGVDALVRGHMCQVRLGVEQISPLEYVPSACPHHSVSLQATCTEDR